MNKMSVALCVQIGTFSRFDTIKESINAFISKYNPDLYLACDENDVEFFLKEYPKGCIIGTPNVCVDVGKFLYCLKAIYLLKKSYDIVIKIHTKKACKWTFDLLELIHPYNFEIIKKKFKDLRIGQMSIDSHIGLPSYSDSNADLLKDLSQIYGKKIRCNFYSYSDLSYEQFIEKVEPQFYSSHPNLNFLGSKEEILQHAFSFAAKRNIALNKNHISSHIGNKFSMGTMFVCRFWVLQKYFGLEQVNFYLQESKDNLEFGYYKDVDGDKYAHTLERLFGFCFDWEGLSLSGIN